MTLSLQRWYSRSISRVDESDELSDDHFFFFITVADFVVLALENPALWVPAKLFKRIIIINSCRTQHDPVWQRPYCCRSKALAHQRHQSKL